ncbi:hypothetical protein C8Q73DRAFT_272672 [Cubamyces lactineus]|nr:hypothetical protein C8Q73DRAFT_272672 [Cubamyces lactineus]
MKSSVRRCGLERCPSEDPSTTSLVPLILELTLPTKDEYLPPTASEPEPRQSLTFVHPIPPQPSTSIFIISPPTARTSRARPALRTNRVYQHTPCVHICHQPTLRCTHRTNVYISPWDAVPSPRSASQSNKASPQKQSRRPRPLPRRRAACSRGGKCGNACDVDVRMGLYTGAHSSRYVRVGRAGGTYRRISPSFWQHLGCYWQVSSLACGDWRDSVVQVRRAAALLKMRTSRSSDHADDASCMRRHLARRSKWGCRDGVHGRIPRIVAREGKQGERAKL